MKHENKIKYELEGNRAKRGMVLKDISNLVITYPQDVNGSYVILKKGTNSNRVTLPFELKPAGDKYMVVIEISGKKQEPKSATTTNGIA